MQLINIKENFIQQQLSEFIDEDKMINQKVFDLFNKENEKTSNFNFKNRLSFDELTKNKTKTTEDKSIKTIINIKKNKIFKIKKVNKFIGRKRKEELDKKEGKHTKYNKDNIIIKIKRCLYNNSLDYINDLIKSSSNNKINKIKLYKIDSIFIIHYSKDDNLYFLNSTTKELLSNKISSKNKLFHPEHNKDSIKIICRTKEKEIIDKLNTTQRQMLKIYCNNNIEKENYKGFKRLEDDIRLFKNKNVEEEYIKLYKNYANNFENIINNTYPREKSRK